jgi:uncharacterized peroxidase-related enzyme
MSIFNVHSKETAPAKSAKLLSNAEKAFGFIPNLLGVLAESPAALKGYLSAGQIFDESSFSPTERQVVILSASRYNNCHYCVAAHSTIANMQQVPADVVKAIRNDEPIADSRLEALRVLTTSVVDKRGWVSEVEIKAFHAAGFTKAQLLEVILGVSFKTLSNYVNHITDTPLDEAFVPQSWKEPIKRQAS